jgi:hypothetical protein
MILAAATYSFSSYLLAIAVVLGVAAYYYFSNKGAQLKRKLGKIERKKMADFVDGEIGKVVGSVTYFGSPIIAPLSGRKCAYYHITIEEGQNTGTHSSWTKIIEEKVGGNLVIQEGVAAFAVIDTNLVSSHLIVDKQYNSGTFNTATDTLETFLLKHNYTSVGKLGFNRSLRYSEGIIEEGEVIAVAGKGTWKRASTLSFELPCEKYLQITADSETPVYLTDDQAAV